MSRRRTTALAVVTRTDTAGTAARTGGGVNLMFRAFSDRTRLRILHLLQGREMCVGDIVDVLRLPQPTISRHLSYLRRARLVRGRKDGLWVFYALAPAETLFQRKLLDCVGACFGDVREIAQDAKRADRIRRSGGCCPG